MSERKFDSHAVDLSPQACGSFWAFLPPGPLWSTCKSASVQGTWWWWAATRMHRACGEEACGLKRVEMWLFLRERGCFSQNTPGDHAPRYPAHPRASQGPDVAHCGIVLVQSCVLLSASVPLTGRRLWPGQLERFRVESWFMGRQVSPCHVQDLRLSPRLGFH